MFCDFKKDLSFVHKQLGRHMTSNKLSCDEKQLLFKLRTRTFDCKSNFKDQFKNDLRCLLCKSDDTQEHLLNCKPIIQNIDTSNINYNDLFSNIEKQVKATKVFMKLSRSKTFLINSPDSQESQAHLL